MDIYFILILITTIYFVLVIRYFDFFRKTIHITFNIITFLTINFLLQIYFNHEINFLLIALQLGIFISFRIHFNIFYLESPTLYLANIISVLRKSSKSKINSHFLKHKFVNYYIELLKKQKHIKKDKEYFILQKNGYLFFKLYEVLYKLFIKWI